MVALGHRDRRGNADAVRLIDAEIGNATAVGPLPQYYLGLAAEVLLAAGRPADALVHLDRAIAGIDEPGVGFYLPEIYRLRGACLLALTAATRTKRDQPSQPPSILPGARARRSSSAARRHRCPSSPVSYHAGDAVIGNTSAPPNAVT